MDSDLYQFDRFLELKRRAAESPDAPALLAPGRHPLSYSGLWDHIRSTRRALHDAGLRPGEAAALVMHGAELLTAFLAIIGESACAPLNTSLTEEEYRYYLSRLGVRIVLVQEELAAAAVAAAQHLGIRILRVHSAAPFAAGVFTLESNAALPVAPGRQTDAALLLYTSATTGNPKLVPLTYANLSAMTQNNSRAFQLGPSDRFLAMMPLFHLHGLGAVLTQLFCGGAAFCMPAFDPDHLRSWFEDFRPTWISGGPPVLHAILAAARRDPESFRRVPLRFIQSSGAPVQPELARCLEEAVRAPVLQGYGMTEAVAVARSTPDARKPGSVGRSIGPEIAIADESGLFLPPDVDGEVMVRGATLMSGYLDDPEANRAAFRDGWFRSGDAGHLDREGFLFITGRMKETINRGGAKIIPSEVDRVLATHPAVAEAAAFPVPHQTLGDEVAAAVVMKDGISTSEADLRHFLGAHLAPFKVPRRIFFVDALPHGATGKLQRSTLTEQFRDLAAGAAECSRAPDATESRLIEIWSRILGVAHVGIEDDFFGLGGDSLSAAVMLTEVQRELNASRVLLDGVDFFDRPTVSVMARLLSTGAQLTNSDSPTHRILPFQKRGSRLPFFCFAPEYLDPYYLRHLAKCLGDDQPFYVVCASEPVRDNRLLKVEELARLQVAAIQDVRPRGPYVLGGHCYGGLVAFEAAQQLLSRGEEITRLVLFDVPTPGYPKVVRNWRRYLAESRRMLAAAARGQVLEKGADAIRHVRTLARIIQRRFGGRAIRALASVGTQTLVQSQDYRQLTALALWEYVPRDFPAPIAQFLAVDDPVTTQVLDDPRLGWRDFARGGLDVFITPGSHATLLDAQNTPALAAQLEHLLQQ